MSNCRISMHFIILRYITNIYFLSPIERFINKFRYSNTRNNNKERQRYGKVLPYRECRPHSARINVSPPDISKVRTEKVSVVGDTKREITIERIDWPSIGYIVRGGFAISRNSIKPLHNSPHSRRKRKV